MQIICKNELLGAATFFILKRRLMSLFRDSRILRPLLAVALLAVMGVIAAGSRSVAFHRWVHGEEADCALTHRAPDASSEHDPSEGDAGEHQDPLRLFCQTGWALDCGLVDVVLAPSSAENYSAPHSRRSPSRRFRASFPPRAPPVLA